MRLLDRGFGASLIAAADALRRASEVEDIFFSLFIHGINLCKDPAARTSLGRFSADSPLQIESRNRNEGAIVLRRTHHLPNNIESRPRLFRVRLRLDPVEISRPEGGTKTSGVRLTTHMRLPG